jgi:hypothetical protein
LYNEELHNFYSSLNIIEGDLIKVGEMGGTYSKYAEYTNPKKI